MNAVSRKPYRLGLDLGTNSLGWFIVWLEHHESRWRPVGLGPGGTRVFPDGRDPQSSTSNAVDRRMARGARKRRDRFVDRRKQLMDALIRHGLMPAEEKDRKALGVHDPYELRAKALDAPLSAYHVGRALFHLNQRRGFLSNRKAEKKEDDKGAIKQGATKLKEAMDADKARTLGEFLWRRHQRADSSVERTARLQAELKRIGKDKLTGGARRRTLAKIRRRLPEGSNVENVPPQSVRARNIATGPKAAYDFYPTRDLFRTEFDAIWGAQSSHHDSMTKEAHEEIARIVFFQRPLRQPPVGKCTFNPATEPFENDPEGYRCPWAHPLAQRFRILKEVRNLEVRETGKASRKLSKEDSDKVALALQQNNKVSFDKIRALLKLPAEARFNLESERRDHLKGDELAERLANRNLFGKTWRGFALERQIAIAEKLLGEADEKALVSWLQNECGLTAAVADKIADAQLPDGHCRLGLRALKKLLPIMANEIAADGRSGVQEHEAAARAGYDHAKLPTGEILDRLPYYGEWLPDAVVGSGDERAKKEKRFGQLPNPTVHIGLGQLRRLVNALIDEYGAPEQVVIELARDLKRSQDEKRKEEARQAKNQKKNDERKTKLAEIGIVNVSGTDLMKMRLWEELGDVVKLCPFSGRPISLTQLMSAEVEVEHLIPYSDSLDNSAANKTVCFTSANRMKGKQTPFEAYGHSAEWPEISARAANLSNNKRWRFAPDARERLTRDGHDFLDRQLMETRWLSTLARQYVSAICNPNEVWVVTGQHTSLIRGKWGLNTLLPDHNFTTAKNRADHRHHAIDALVVAVTDRSLLQRIASAYDNERDKIDIPLPWPTLRDDLEGALKRMIVSHKPDHGYQGKLHKDTAHGFVSRPEKEGANLVYRPLKPFKAISENEVERIRDVRLREMVTEHVKRSKENGLSFKEAIETFAKVDPKTGQTGIAHIKHGLRRVRLLKVKEAEYLVPVKNRQTGAIYKAYELDENFCVEVFETKTGRWLGEPISFFDANRKNHVPQWRDEHSEAKLVMRVHKGDLIRVNDEGLSKIMVVHRLDAASGRFKLAAHCEAGKLDKRHDEDTDPFRWLMASYGTLKNMDAIPVRVDELGRVWRVHPRN